MMAGHCQCLWQCLPLPHPVCSAALPCSASVSLHPPGLYRGLEATIITEKWETPLIPLQKGVYQGNPLSVVIFNTVMNTLVDTIVTRVDLGYQFSGSLYRVSILQYANDTCLVANSPASCQFLLSKVGDWLEWTGMVAKVPKCQCSSLEGSTG